jgi:hypothetical protein
MNIKSLFTATLLLPAFMALSAAAADLKLEAQLVWGTSTTTSKHQPVEDDVRRKLASLPLKWSNFYEVRRQKFDVAPDETKRADLSEKCAVEVKNLGGGKVEVVLFGKGKEIWKGTQHLPRGEILVLGGNAPAESAWLVTLKRIE